MKQRFINYLLGFISILVFCYLLVSCQGKGSATTSLYFDKDGKSKDNVSAFHEQKPSQVKFYIEVSGSMNGFFRSNQPTRFKHDVWSVVSDIISPTDSVFVFTQQNAPATSVSLNTFKEGMNTGAFLSTFSTDVPNMLSHILNDISSEKEIGVLISDMKYDPVGNSALSVLLSQYATDIRNLMMHYKDKAICLIASYSDYIDRNGNIACANSPYYYIVVGKMTNVVWMRNFIATLLKNHQSYVDEIEWGIDYKSPNVTVEDADYLTEIDKNHSYEDFDKECTIKLKMDITSLPWNYEIRDTLMKHVSITTEEGTDVKILTNEIKYDVKYDNGKELKRTAMVQIPVHISNMYTKSDVLQFNITYPKMQSPNAAFRQFLGAEDVNDVSKTFSMEGLLQGFYSVMERYTDSKPIHILISK